MARNLSDRRAQETETTTPESGRTLQRLRASAPILALCLLALTLRLWGITWGLPNQQRLFSYHPDEGVNLINGVLDNGVARPHIRLGFYNYGGLYFYLWQGATAINHAYGFVQRPATGAPAPDALSIGAMILVGRLLTAILGALTVWAVFALGCRLFGRTAGLLAGATCAVMPAAVVHGHYATVDVPATLFVTLALVFGAQALEQASPTPQYWGELKEIRSLLLAGLFSGLAAATKYNCGTVLFAPLAVLVLRRKQLFNSAPRIAMALVGLLAVAVVGFALACPGVWLDSAAFWWDVGFELKKSSAGMGLLFVNTGDGWSYHLTRSLRYGLGLPLLLLTLIALVFSLARRTRQDRYLLAFWLPYYLVIGFAQVRFLRYVIPLFPVLAVLVGRLLTEPWHHRPALARALTGLGAIVGLATLMIALNLDRLMTLPDARDLAARYIRDHVPDGASIAFATTPWYYTPPLSPGFTAPSPAARREAAQSLPNYRLRLPTEGAEWDMRVFDPPPDYALLSASESDPAIRLDWAPARPFLARLQADYKVQVFENTRGLFGIPIQRPTRAPDDWLYIFPRITLYTRR